MSRFIPSISIPHQLGLLLAVSVALQAQYTSLSTDSIGSTLFFTAEFTQPDSAQPAWGKLFIAGDEGVRPFLIRSRDVTPVRVFNDGHITNAYDLVGVDLASNGSRLAVAGARECTVTVQFCQFMDTSDVYGNQGQYLFTANGLVSFSPNGEWALAVGVSAAAPFTQLTLIEVATGRRYALPTGLGNRYWRLHKVADNGTVAYLQSGRLILFHPSSGMQETFLGGEWVAIDASASTVVLQRPSTLQVVQTARLSAPLNLTPPGWRDFAPRISDNGQRILFLSTPSDTDDPQIYSVNPDGSQRRQVIAIPEGVMSAILSGNGEVSWAATRTGRLLKISLLTGQQQEFIGPVAAFYWPSHCSGTFYGGSLSAGLGQVITVDAYVMPGEAVKVFLGSTPATVTDVAVQRVSFRIPTTLPPGGYSLSIQKPGDPNWLAKSIPIGVRTEFVPQESLTQCGPGDNTFR
ncbi:MAG: hypothetical protein U0R19_13140 [Bryobacteraceae bacterium]